MILQDSVKVNSFISVFCSFVIIHKYGVIKMWNLYSRIELLCKEKNINITQMCREMQMPRSIMSELKAGRTIRLSAENSSKLAQYFGVSVNYFLNNIPFDWWENINDDRKGFFYYIPVSYNTLKTIWGIDKECPENARITDIIAFMNSCIKHCSVDCNGDWDIELKEPYEKMWQTELTNENENINYSSIPGIMPLPKTVKKPRLGQIACGEPIMTEENFDGYDDVPNNISCDFTLICKGDSMINARIHDGDIVYIKQQPTVENGQIAAIMIDGETTLKRVYIDGDRLTIMPENPAYKPHIYIGEELNNIRIIGRATGFTSYID